MINPAVIFKSNRIIPVNDNDDSDSEFDSRSNYYDSTRNEKMYVACVTSTLITMVMIAIFL